MLVNPIGFRLSISIFWKVTWSLYKYNNYKYLFNWDIVFFEYLSYFLKKIIFFKKLSFYLSHLRFYRVNKNIVINFYYYFPQLNDFFQHLRKGILKNKWKYSKKQYNELTMKWEWKKRRNSKYWWKNVDNRSSREELRFRKKFYMLVLSKYKPKRNSNINNKTKNFNNSLNYKKKMKSFYYNKKKNFYFINISNQASGLKNYQKGNKFFFNKKLIPIKKNLKNLKIDYQKAYKNFQKNISLNETDTDENLKNKKDNKDNLLTQILKLKGSKSIGKRKYLFNFNYLFFNVNNWDKRILLLNKRKYLDLRLDEKLIFWFKNFINKNLKKLEQSSFIQIYKYCNKFYYNKCVNISSNFISIYRRLKKIYWKKEKSLRFLYEQQYYYDKVGKADQCFSYPIFSKLLLKKTTFLKKLVKFNKKVPLTNFGTKFENINFISKLYLKKFIFAFKLFSYNLFIFIWSKFLKSENTFLKDLKKVKINCFEIVVKNINARIILNYLTATLRNNYSIWFGLRRVIADLNKRVLIQNLSGYKILFSGRFKRALRATYVWRKSGQFSIGSPESGIDYAVAFHRTKYGVGAVKVWLSAGLRTFKYFSRIYPALNAFFFLDKTKYFYLKKNELFFNFLIKNFNMHYSFFNFKYIKNALVNILYTFLYTNIFLKKLSIGFSLKNSWSDQTHLWNGNKSFNDSVKKKKKKVESLQEKINDKRIRKDVKKKLKFKLLNLKLELKSLLNFNIPLRSLYFKKLFLPHYFIYKICGVQYHNTNFIKIKPFISIHLLKRINIRNSYKLTIKNLNKRTSLKKVYLRKFQYKIKLYD